MRLDPDWFQYPADRGLPAQAPIDRLVEVEFAEFPIVRDVIIRDFVAKGDIRTVRAANQLSSRKRSRSRSSQSKGNKLVQAKQKSMAPSKKRR